MVAVSGFVSIYYNIIITWVLYYLIKSFTKNLPWAKCGNDWNTLNCLESSKYSIQVGRQLKTSHLICKILLQNNNGSIILPSSGLVIALCPDTAVFVCVSCPTDTAVSALNNQLHLHYQRQLRL